jgi:hypothetical protein
MYGRVFDEDRRMTTASFLAMAMHKGQLPLLQSLSMAGFEWKFMDKGANLGLVSSAVTLGRLPHLFKLTLMRGPCLDQMANAFQSRLCIDQFSTTPPPSQAMVKTLHLEYPLTGVLREAGSLYDLLSLPVFRCLEEVDLNVELLYDSLDFRQGQVLTQYLHLRQPWGRPTLDA